MPLFICEKCRCVDNTALGGTYWTKDVPNMWPPEAEGKALCTECAPPVFRDGSPRGEGGKWHGEFPKEVATPEVIERIGRNHFIDLRSGKHGA